MPSARWGLLLPAMALAQTVAGHGWIAGPPGPDGLWPRGWHALVQDSARGRLVLVGGFGGLGFLGDTWELSGGVWSAGPSLPVPREGRANVGAGAIDGDAFAEILTAPGPGAAFGPVVKGFDYDGVAIAAIGKVSFSAFAVPQYGATVAAGDADMDGFDEIAAGPGPGASSAFPVRVRGFDYDGSALTAAPGFDATALPTVFGARVQAGFTAGIAREQVLVSGGPDPAADSTVVPYTYSGSALLAFPIPFTAMAATMFGVDVAIGDLGY